jgi:hypothetical protein
MINHSRPKVICIGWHKTGTTTMGFALLKLGYDVLGARMDMVYPLMKGDVDTPLRLAGEYGALQDVPWANLFKELDQKYPGSKFILTVRDEKSWLKSATKHFGEKYYKMHEWIYGQGVLKGNEDLYLKKFRQHYQEVNEYFTGREDDILIMDLAKGDGWDKLCHFLSRPIPKSEFPHANKGKHSRSKKEILIRKIKNVIPFSFRLKVVNYLEKRGLHNRRNVFNNREANQKERGKIL